MKAIKKQTPAMSVYEVAIIDANTLVRIGLQHIIEEVMPSVAVRSFGTMDELMDNAPDGYDRYLVSSAIYLTYNTFFRRRISRTVVLVSDRANLAVQGVATLVTAQGERALIRSIMALRDEEVQVDMSVPIRRPVSPYDLTSREIEVLKLLVKGHKNRDIAERLHISLTTVISHRKNIVDKLGIKSVPSLTIYAVLNGYIDADYI